MAMSSLCSLMLFTFVLSIIFEYSLAIKNINIYRKYYIEDSCTDNENFTYVLSRTGIYSVVQIRAFRLDELHHGARNCRVVIKPPYGYSVFLQISTFRFGYSYNNSSGCASYIQVFGNGTASDKLCKLRSRLPSTSFTTYGNMTIVVHTENDYLLAGLGFTLIATAYETSLKVDSASVCVGYDTFLCDNGRCIWRGLTCDSVDNCGDSSDEMSYGRSQCFDIGPFTMKPIDFNWEISYPTSEIVTFRSSHNISLGAAIATAVFVIIGALIRFYCYYQCNQARRREVLSAVTIIRARSVLRQSSLSNGTAPPPYETLVNDSEIHPESPPEYTVVTEPSSLPCNPQNGATPNFPAITPRPTGADKNVNVSCDPPPPYEP